MKKKKILRIVLTTFIILLLVLCVAIKVIIKKDTEKKLEAPGNAELYSLENTEVNENSPLQGKRVLFLGSSVTVGMAAQNVSFADYLAKQDGVIADKEAYSSTTLVDEFNPIAQLITGNGNSYVTRLNNVDTNIAYDAVVVQLSTNDATGKKTLGEISTSDDIEDYDVKTVTGAMEYIISYVYNTWNCPVIFYTGTYYESDEYAAMVDRLLELQNKWGITVVNLYTDVEFNDIDENTYALYMYDDIHPTKAGYREWWLPKIEKGLLEALNLN